MTLSEAIRFARTFLAEDYKLILIDNKMYGAGEKAMRVAEVYNTLAKHHGRMDDMERFADTYLEKEASE
jgi:hypothetical protein